MAGQSKGKYQCDKFSSAKNLSKKSCQLDLEVCLTFAPKTKPNPL